MKGEPHDGGHGVSTDVEEGVAINFFISNDGLKYEISPEEAEKRGILFGNIIMSCAACR